MCIGLKETMNLQKGKPKWNVENLYAVRQKAGNFVEINFLELDLELEM
jgi:hypothetical protein